MIGQKVARTIVETQPYLHPRLYGYLVKSLWPFLREADGFIPVRFGPIEMRVDLREDAERHIFLHSYDPPLTQLFQRILRPGDVAVDVGANAGALTVTAANAVGETGCVWAIEPNPKLAERLQALANRNPLRNIQVLACAVGDRNAKLPFYVSSSHPYSSLDQSCLPNYPVDTVLEVPVKTLDDLWTEILGKLHIRLLKLDAQGYENRILNSARKIFAVAPPDYVVVEVYTEGLRQALANLQDRRYTMQSVGSSGKLLDLTSDMPSEGANLVLIHSKSKQEL